MRPLDDNIINLSFEHNGGRTLKQRGIQKGTRWVRFADVKPGRQSIGSSRVFGAADPGVRALWSVATSEGLFFDFGEGFAAHLRHKYSNKASALRTRAAATADADLRQKLLRQAKAVDAGKSKKVRALHETVMAVVTTVCSDFFLPPNLSKQWASKGARKAKKMPATLGGDVYNIALGRLHERIQEVRGLHASPTGIHRKTHTHSSSTPHARTQAQKMPSNHRDGEPLFKVHLLDSEAYTTAVCGLCGNYEPPGPVKVIHCHKCKHTMLRDVAAARKILLLGLQMLDIDPKTLALPDGDALGEQGSRAAPVTEPRPLN